jgi:serine/threonine protein kinase
MKKRLPLSADTVLQSRYTIVGQLGHGGMGAVYEAKDNRTSATVALKETFADDDYTRNAFEREAKMLANMTHEAFPRVMDYFAEGDGFYLVMELIRGKDLSELLEERNAPFETEQVLEWADQILDALEDLHSQDIVHRDIKPSNLKLTPRGRIKLLDFGIAKGAAGDMAALQSTVGSMAAATLQYAPLEQVLRADANWFQMLCVNFSDKTLSILDQGTDARSDLYALGATLYHLLTNTLPINAPTRALSIWTGQADKLCPAHERNLKVSNALSTVLQKALEIDRERRLGSANEMRKLLGNSNNEAHEKTVVIGDEKTFPLVNQPIFPTPNLMRSEQRFLTHDSTTDVSNAVDALEQETVARVLPSNVNAKKRNNHAWGIIGILAIVPIFFGVLFLSYGPTANKSGGSGDTSVITDANAAISNAMNTASNAASRVLSNNVNVGANRAEPPANKTPKSNLANTPGGAVVNARNTAVQDLSRMPREIGDTYLCKDGSYSSNRPGYYACTGRGGLVSPKRHLCKDGSYKLDGPHIGPAQRHDPCYNSGGLANR